MTDHSIGSDKGQTPRQLVLVVPDMDCASCARRVSNGLQELKGVESVEPRVLSKDVLVQFDPGRVGADKIADVVRSLGYDIEREGGTREPGRWVAGVWESGNARRSYFSGGLLAAGLALRLLSLSPVLWTGLAWRIDLAALLYTAAAIVGGFNFFLKGFRAARRLELDMNFLMTVAIFGALVIGEFVEAASIAFLFGIAELLERYSVERARRSLEELLNLAPASARLRRGDTIVTVTVEEIELGDIVVVKPGEKIPIDGWVREGASSVDESPITGESLPVTRSISDYVYAGSMNGEGYLEVEAAKRAGDTTLAHIVHLVEEAEASKAPSERFVEKFAQYYTPTVTGLAVALMVIPPLALGGGFGTWFVRGLTLLVISCPCALVISTPVAVVSAITSAARNGVLIKGGAYLEALGRVRVVAFDKTGTLTAGRLEVVEVVPSPSGGPTADEILELAAALESRSEHPIAEAIRAKAGLRSDGRGYRITEFQAVTGRGARARLDGEIYQIGRPELFGDAVEAWKPALNRLAASGRTAVCVGGETSILGLVVVADRARQEARRALTDLRRLGIERIVMLTGDNEATARAVASDLGVDEYYAGLMPEEKLEKVRQLEAEAGNVAMVGDGVNDAPALAAASVGIAMGAAASDVALETADVALMADDLGKLPYLFELSRRGSGVIRQNIAASIAIKFSLAAGVPFGWVNLITAVLVGDLGSSLAVTLNALRLGRLRHRRS